MRIWLGLPAVRILPRRFWFRYNSTAMPVHDIYRAACVSVKYEFTVESGILSNFSSHMSSFFSHQRKYVTVSSSHESICNNDLENRHTFDSSESRENKITDDAQVLPPLLEEIYNELMTAPKWLTNNDWSAVDMKFSKERFLSALWPTMLLHFIAQKTEAVPGLYSVGMSLVDYVGSLSDRHRLLRLVSAVAVCIHQGGEDHHEEALALYDALCNEYGVFDHKSARTLITALARTRYWRRCLELVDQVKITAQPGPKDYSPIVVAAMMNQDDDLAEKLLETLSRNGLKPGDEMFLQMLATGRAEQVLTVLRDYVWIPSKLVIDSVIRELQRYTINCFYDPPC